MNVAVLGLGYVGLVAATALAGAGHHVLGIDLDKNKTQALQNGRLPLYEPGIDELLRQGISKGTLRFSNVTDVVELNCELVMVAVSTPSLPNGAADLSQVKSALKWIIEKTKKPVVVVMKSTVPPGTGRKLIDMYFSSNPLKHQYVSNPEFLKEGQALKDWYHPDRIVIGSECNEAVKKVKELYVNTGAPVVVTDTTTAEMIKYAANAFLATRISFINEIAGLCDLTGANIDDVTKGIALDPRIGTNFLKAGIGYGGSCFPKDVRALDFLSTANGYNFELLKAVINVNNRQRFWPVSRLKQRLGDLAGKVVAILGLAFKPGTDDVRESPALYIIHLLMEEGALVRAHDPIAMANAARFLPPEVTFTETAMEALHGAGAAVLTTEWPELVNLAWPEVAHCMQPPRIVIDGRNCLPAKALLSCGLVYIGIGRQPPGASL